MRRDSIFYRLFQQSPTLLFELLPVPPPNANGYRFDSVAVKEPKFEIDGVFLPPEAEGAGMVYFCEVQFQKDEQLYERLFGESFLYFYRNRERFSDWQAIVLYPTRTVEQSNTHPYRSLLNSEQVHRVYLNELGEIRQLPLGLALMVLTTTEAAQAPEEARYLLARSQQEASEPTLDRAIIELVTTIMVYKFVQLSRLEVEAMLGLTLQETQFYQDAKADGKQEGRQEGRQEAEQRERSLILRQLTRKVGELPSSIAEQLEQLSIVQLESLGEALLEFSSLTDLETWLEH